MLTPQDIQNLENHQRAWSRRTFLGKSAQAIGTLALGSIMNPSLLGQAGTWRGVLDAPHYYPQRRSGWCIVYERGTDARGFV